jgi:4-hydroxybenzoate polyprenyltransferase
LNALTICGLPGLAVSISYLLASDQPHFSQCLCLKCFFATLDGGATFNGFTDLTVLGVAVDFIGGAPN